MLSFFSRGAEKQMEAIQATNPRAAPSEAPLAAPPATCPRPRTRGGGRPGPSSARPASPAARSLVAPSHPVPGLFGFLVGLVVVGFSFLAF